MAHQDPIDPLSEFDALLRQELSVEPSNSFLPTVRERIRNEPVSTPWMWPWRFVSIAAAAALVLALGVFMWSPVNDTNPAPAPTASAPSPTQAPASATPPLREPTSAPPPSRAALRRASNGPTFALRATAGRQRPAKEPEVIVDARQREALHAFVRMINQGQLTAEKFAQTTPPPLDIADAVTIIGVVPVSVSPIVVGGVLQGESERK